MTMSCVFVRFKPLKISMHACTYSAKDRMHPSPEDAGRLHHDAINGAPNAPHINASAITQICASHIAALCVIQHSAGKTKKRICVFPLEDDAVTGQKVSTITNCLSSRTLLDSHLAAELSCS